MSHLARTVQGVEESQAVTSTHERDRVGEGRWEAREESTEQEQEQGRFGKICSKANLGLSAPAAGPSPQSFA